MNALAEATELALREVYHEPQSPRARDAVMHLIQQLYELLDSDETARAGGLKYVQRLQLARPLVRVLGILRDMRDVAAQVEDLGGEAPWRIPLTQAVKRVERELRRWKVPVPSPTAPRPTVVRDPTTGALGVRDPESPIERYIAAALHGARPYELEDGEGWVVELEGFPGVWASGSSAQECLETLDEVLRGWLRVKLEHHDRDIPVVNNIELPTVIRG